MPVIKVFGAVRKYYRIWSVSKFGQVAGISVRSKGWRSGPVDILQGTLTVQAGRPKMLVFDDCEHEQNVAHHSSPLLLQSKPMGFIVSFYNLL